MKKIPYFITALVYFLFLSVFNVNAQKRAGKDTIPTKKAIQKKDGPREKRLAFLNKDMIKRMEDSSDIYSPFRAKFDIVPIEKFDQFHNEFKRMFDIGGPSPTINYFLPLPFSINEKYVGFQSERDLQQTEFQGVTRKFTNIIRVYPAIDPGNIFYLVLMRELEDIPAGDPPARWTDKYVYYSIKYGDPAQARGAQFTQVLNQANAETDIKKFQKKLEDIATAPHTPSLTFRKERSFSYSIGEYDELLGSTFFYWKVADEKEDPYSNVIVLIFPGIDKSNSADVRFRLMLKLCKLTVGGYKEIPDKAIYDNMDPCPNVCPNPLTDIIKIP